MGSGSPAELLVTEKAELAVQENKETKERMLQLVISSLVLGSAAAAPQDYQSYLSQLHQYRMEYLPESVNSYSNKTWEEGRDVAYDLYDDIKEEALSKSDAHVDALTNMMEKFFERANEIHSSIKTVLEQEGALSDEEIQARADKEGLDQLRKKFDDLEEELEREFWSKMKQLEVQFYQMKSASADTAASLRDWVTAAFQTMNEIDLNAIGGSSDILVDEPRAN